MGEIHERSCGAHQSGKKMKWFIKRYGYFWQTMENDCFSYAKGCEDCQQNRRMQHTLAVPLNLIIKTRPFRGWAMYFVGKIAPSSSHEHTFLIIATDYFTKWVEAKALKTISSVAIVTFIKQQIIHRENSHAEFTNKILINIIKKMEEDNPRDWHKRLSKALWADRTSKKMAIGTTPFALTYGHDAVLLVEINVQSLRLEKQSGMDEVAYTEAMMQGLNQLSAIHAKALNHLTVGKQEMARAYNKRVHEKTFEEGALVCWAILPLGTHVAGLRKWSPT
ncbi:unnamed protein product [Prunus armeniaca]